MERTLENQFLKITIRDLGAELISVYDKATDRELLWQADPTFWNRHAPVLFPNVGRHFKNVYRINGKEYPSSQHGFARDTEFVMTDRNDSSVTHLMQSTTETLKNYPFSFSFSVTHTLNEKTLTISWEVVNTGNDTMYFTIGGHPAFNIPLKEGEKQSDYRLYFPDKSTLSYKLIDMSYGTIIPDVSYTLELDEKHSCEIKEGMFDKDALVFDEQFEKAGFLSPDGKPLLEMDAQGFPSFGIWAAMGGAPFICLEPWAGRCDDCGFDKELSEKAYINVLEPNGTFHKAYSITVF